MNIGAEVGLATDRDRRGVVVDSHPTNGWLVWWCFEMAARWQSADELWLRPPAAPDDVWLRETVAKALGDDPFIPASRAWLAVWADYLSAIRNAPPVTLDAELAALLNKYSCENDSDTPDFILAQYLLASLAAFNDAVTRRGQWFTSGLLDFPTPASQTTPLTER